MLETVSEWVDWLGLSPKHLIAVGLALMISWCATQVVKEVAGWHGWRARLSAFVLAFLSCYMVAPGYGELEFWLAVCVGLAAPAAYKLLVVLAGERWAWVAKLSGDRK